MTHIIQVGPTGSLTLSKAICSLFKPKDEVIVFASKDTVILKKLHHAKLSEVAHSATDKPMPMKDIVSEIGRYRHERRNPA